MPPPRRRAAAALTALLAVLAGCTAPPRTPPPNPIVSALPAPAADAGRSDPVADPLYPDYGNPALDVLHYRLDLSWSPGQTELTGTATLTIRTVRPVTALALDFAPGLTVDGVNLDGVATQPQRRGNDLVVAAPAPLAAQTRVTLMVRYHGVPASVPMPSARADFPEGVGLRAAADGSAWTMQEPFGAFTWYPANDQPSDEALYDIAVRVPAGWAAVASGALVGIDETSDASTYRWRSVDPVASYLVTLAIGHYTLTSLTGPHGLPVTLWLRTGVDEGLAPAVRRVPDLLGWLEDHFGPYPFPTAGVVLVDSVSAMETQQMVTLGAKAGTKRPTDAYTEVLLHELAHQWFGDSVTPRDWQGIWLNEGFATYAEWLWSVDEGLKSDAAWLSWARERDAISRVEAGPPGHPKPDHFAENNVYAGPALLLRELHLALGDEAFFALARDWVQSQRNHSVDRAAFTAFVNRRAGRDVTALIDEWLDAPSTPAIT
jgi:aminopeptidase N